MDEIKTIVGYVISSLIAGVALTAITFAAQKTFTESGDNEDKVFKKTTLVVAGVFFAFWMITRRVL